MYWCLLLHDNIFPIEKKLFQLPKKELVPILHSFQIISWLEQVAACILQSYQSLVHTCTLELFVKSFSLKTELSIFPTKQPK